MKYIILLLVLFLISCESEIIYIEKQVFEHPGLLEVHNELFDGSLYVKTDGNWRFADTIYIVNWFKVGDIKSFKLNEGGYRVELIYEGVGHYSSGAIVFRDSTVVKVIN